MEKRETPKLARDLSNIAKEAEKIPGFNLENLEVGKRLKIKTGNTKYTLERRKDGLYISGHLKYCPFPEKVRSIGTLFGDSAIKYDHIIPNEQLEFVLEKMVAEALANNEKPKRITTSPVQSIQELEK